MMYYGNAVIAKFILHVQRCRRRTRWNVRHITASSRHLPLVSAGELVACGGASKNRTATIRNNESRLSVARARAARFHYLFSRRIGKIRREPSPITSGHGRKGASRRKARKTRVYLHEEQKERASKSKLDCEYRAAERLNHGILLLHSSHASPSSIRQVLE